MDTKQTTYTYTNVMQGFIVHPNVGTSTYFTWTTKIPTTNCYESYENKQKQRLATVSRQ